MSTFGGVMVEFPEVRVDYFRPVKGMRPPLACFLSHVHSDHLEGLEGFKSPFIYCSAATKGLLLRLERYPHRLNFANGLLEARKLHYKNLRTLLKPIPLETPTKIELFPGKEIQVTLFDANHCTGAVMFLFEGGGKAVLYTGDIRSEPWFVNNLIRNPFLIEYSAGIKILDCIYLDTSHLGPEVFPTKAEGLKELLQKILKYPDDTVFHFSAWTFGYEEVWMALSKALKSPIHVDKYNMRLYNSLRGDSVDKNQTFSGPLAHEGPALAGYQCGNAPHAGCLTVETNVRLHSCGKGMKCDKINDNPNVVWIKPIIARTKEGEDIPELGVGGGGEDLIDKAELELDASVIEQFQQFFATSEDAIQAEVKNIFTSGNGPIKRVKLLDDIDLNGDLTIMQFADAFKGAALKKQKLRLNDSSNNQEHSRLSKVITFPYARHSSYDELRHLVLAFKPKDVYPCTVDETGWQQEGISISSLFGHECSSSTFRLDIEMGNKFNQLPDIDSSQRTEQTGAPAGSNTNLLSSSPLPSISRATNGSPSQFSIRGNSEGRLVEFDSQGVEAERIGKLLTIVTPPRIVAAVSPGSESQSLRRKAIQDGLEAGNLKRIRLQLDSQDNEPIIEPQNRNKKSQEDWLNSAIVTSDLEEDNSQNSNAAIAREASPPFSAFRDEDGNEIMYDEDDSDPIYTAGLGFLNEHDLEDNVFFDSDDEVYRCRLCGHEFWSEFIGFCTGCKAGQTGIPYLEIINLDAGPRPEIEVTDLAEALGAGTDRKEVVGDYLDDCSSAYDTQDAADAAGDDFTEEYEIDSFIDDASQDSPEGESENSDEDENASSQGPKNNYKAMFEQLQTENNRLRTLNHHLSDKYERFRREVLGSDYNSEEADDLDGMDEREMEMEMDEDGMFVVEVVAPDPIITELVLSQLEEESEESETTGFARAVILSQAQGQSQTSEITEDRIHDRTKAFEVVNSGRSWNEVSLMSVDDNHTHEEVEL